MVGRNNPCPCGSGKKFKKCCENNQQETLQKVFSEEIEQVLQTFYNVYPERKDATQYFNIVQKWLPDLENYLQRDLIEAVALDDFFFYRRLDIWTNYLKRTMKKIIRPSTLELLQKWEKPQMFIGQVDSIDANYFKATNALTKSEICIRRESKRVIPEGMQIFAFLLPDGTAENSFLAVSTLIFYPNKFNQVFERFGKKYKESGQTEYDFLKENHLNFWKQLVEFGYSGEEYTPFEIEVVDQTKEFLLERNLTSDRLIETLEDYLVEKKPKARKASAIAAGAIRYGQERGFFEGTFTVKEIADSFNVSASSLNKYYQELLQFDAVLV